MIKGRNIRQMLRDAGNGRNFKAEFRRALGIQWDPVLERSYIKDPQISTEEFSIRNLTEEFLGREFIEACHVGPLTSTQMDTMKYATENMQEKALFEDTAIGLSPSVFQDINAWNASVSGLIEVRLLAAYNRPDFIWEDFVEVQPTRVNGGKIIGIPYIGDYAEDPTGCEFSCCRFEPTLFLGSTE